MLHLPLRNRIECWREWTLKPSQFLVNMPEPPALPGKFTTFGTKWHSFYEGFKGHLMVQCGCMDIPLIYVIREHTDVTAAMRNANNYDLSDARLIAIFVLEGDEYDQDNKQVWNLLCPLVYGTPAWSYVKSYDRTKNRWTAWRVLAACGKGEAAMDARQTKAEHIIATARYTGKSKQFTVGDYINLFQSAFVEMEEVGDPYTERRKVNIIVKGMMAPQSAATRTSIMQMKTTRNDFQAAYTFIETMEQFDLTLLDGATAFDRNVGSVVTEDGDVDTSH